MLNRSRLVLAVLMCAGIVMSATLLTRHPAVTGDSLRYLFPIHNLVGGNGYTYRGTPELLFPPGLGIVSYLVYQAVRDVALSGALVAALSYILLIPTTYLSAKLLFGERTALFASVFVTFSPWLLRFSYEGLTDVPYSLLYLVGFTTYARILIHGNSIGRSVVLGAALGGAYLMRPEAFIPAVLVIVSLLGLSMLRVLRRGAAGRSWKELLAPGLTLTLFAVLALPYMAFVHDHLGVWTISTKTTLNLVMGEQIADGTAHFDRLLVDHPEYWDPGHRIDLLDYIRSRRATIANRIAVNALDEVRAMAGVTLHAMVPFLGLLLMTVLTGNGRSFGNVRAAMRQPARVAAFAVFLAPLGVLLLFYVRVRHMLPYATLVLILAAHGIVVLLAMNHWIAVKGWRPHAAVLVVVLSLASASGLLTSRVSLLRVLTNPTSPSLASVRAAGVWLRERTEDPDDLTIIGVGRGCGDMVMYYAGGEGMPTGRFIPITLGMTLDQAAVLVRSGEADFMVLATSCGRPYTPEILRVWDDPGEAREYGLSLVHSDPGVFQVYAGLP